MAEKAMRLDPSPPKKHQGEAHSRLALMLKPISSSSKA